MQLTISGHHVDVTPAIRQHVEGKLEPIQRHGDQITRIEVTLIVERHLHKAEANLHVAGPIYLRHPSRMTCTKP